jgi:hypothetical protein
MSDRFTHNFSIDEKEWFMENFKPFHIRFWKKSLREVGGTKKLKINQ